MSPCSQHRPAPQGVPAENGAGRFLISAWVAIGAVDGEGPFILPRVVEEPGQLAEGGQDGHLPGWGELCGFQSQHGEGGVGSLEAPLQKENLVIWLLLVSLPADTALFAPGTRVLQEENAD